MQCAPEKQSLFSEQIRNVS